MDRENWKVIAELVGVAAIVLSLLLVVIELRQTQDAIAVSGIQSRMIANIEEASSIYNSETLPAILVKSRGAEPLNDEEELRFAAWFRAYHRVHEATFLQVESGYIPEWALEEPTISIKRVIRPGSIAADQWNSNKSIYAPQYQEFVEMLLAE